MLPTLYEIAAEYKADIDKLADLELSPEAVADTIEGMSGELQQKAQNIGYLVRQLETTAQAIKDAEAQMAARRKAIENRTQSIKDYVLNVMQMHSIEKIETPYFNLSLAKNPPAVDIYDSNQVPAHFMKQPEPPPPVPDKAAIKQSLKLGEDVPGCRLSQSVRLTIK